MGTYTAAKTVDQFSSSREAFELMTTHLASGEALRMSHVDVERYVVEEAGREVLRLLLQDAFELRATKEVIAPVEGADGIDRRWGRESERTLMTSVGAVTVRRRQYRGDGARESLHPMDAVLNLPLQAQSFVVQQRVTMEAARGSYDSAVDAVTSSTGAVVCKRQAEQIVQAAATDFDAFYAQQESAEVNPDDLLVVSVDGKGIVVREGDLREKTRKAAAGSSHKLTKRLSKGEKRNRKRMAEVAVVYDVAPFTRTVDEVMNDLRPVRDIDKRRPKPKNKRVWASIEKGMEAVVAEAFDEGERHDPDHRRTWVGLVDGNKQQINAMRAEAKKRGIALFLLLDVIHAVEYLWRAAWCFHAEGDPKAQEWVHARLELILGGKSSDVAAGIRRSATLRKLSGQPRKTVDTCANYLLKNRALMRYDDALARGMPIATGLVEGACRHLVKDRMDLTGARWSLSGAEAVLRFRALRASGDFDNYWDFHLKQELARNHQSRYAAKVSTLAERISPKNHLRLVPK
jgi:hypothetical protein